MVFCSTARGHPAWPAPQPRIVVADEQHARAGPPPALPRTVSAGSFLRLNHFGAVAGIEAVTRPSLLRTNTTLRHGRRGDDFTGTRARHFSLPLMRPAR
jgi:hypothetical protein